MSPRNPQLRLSPNAADSAGRSAPGDADAIDLYLDDAMHAAERTAFESRLATDPDLRRQVEAGRRADAWLRERYQPPDFAGVPAPRPAPLARLGRWRMLGLAALLALAAIAAWQFGLLPGSSGPSMAQVARGDVGAWFKAARAADFPIEWVCKDDAELARYTRERLGQAWTIAPDPDLTLVGWAYTDRLMNSGYSNVLYARYGGRPIAVVADTLEADPGLREPADKSVHLFRREIGPLVVYEISPIDRPVVLDRISASDSPG